MQNALKFIGTIELAKATALLSSIVATEESRIYPLWLETDSTILWNLLDGRDIFNNKVQAFVTFKLFIDKVLFLASLSS